VNTRLLMVDDDEKLCRLVREYLEPLGYDVIASHDGAEGLSMALAGGYAAVILDVMLPSRNGIDVLQALRKESSVPVLMLTALGDESDRIAGLGSARTTICRRPFRRGSSSHACARCCAARSSPRERRSRRSRRR
jgi:DNA-binding response OmpR family regulator